MVKGLVQNNWRVLRAWVIGKDGEGGSPTNEGPRANPLSDLLNEQPNA